MELETATLELPEDTPPDDELVQALLEEAHRLADHVLPGVPFS